MSQPKVYAPQQPSRFDAALRLWIPTMNMDPAKKFGELVIMLPPNANRLHTEPLCSALRERMADYCEDDYFIAIGDPSLIAATACIAARKTGGLLRLLKWDRLTSDYLFVEMRV